MMMMVMMMMMMIMKVHTGMDLDDEDHIGLLVYYGGTPPDNRG